MRELAQLELNAIAGGAATCIDVQVLQNVKDQAYKDATKLILFGDGLLMCAAYGAATALGHMPVLAGLGIAVGLGIIAAPYMAIAGYSGSTAWKILDVNKG